MALRDEILPYTDGNKLVAPNLTNGAQRGSDNGPMFTSEHFIMLRYRGEEAQRDGSDFRGRLLSCMGPAGILHRSPGAPGQEGPDDHYGVLAGCKVFGFHDIAEAILDHGLKHFGCLNTPNPEGYIYPETYEDPTRAGKFNWQATLFRQLQLVAAMYAASNRARFYHAPLFFYAAICIAQGGLFSDLGNADARRLPWLLVQTVSEESFLCWLAQKIWYRTLYRQYPGGMREVAKLYYQQDHPFKKYWMDKPANGFKLPVVSMLQTLGTLAALGAALTVAILK